MMEVSELVEWLQRCSPGDMVGIDEGGLALCVGHDLQFDGTDDYIEIGGFPEEGDTDE
jgi:hypothetical protein